VIFNKQTTYPYPIYAFNSDSYKINGFELDISIVSESTHYRFDISYMIESNFIKDLMNKEKLSMYLVINSKDSKFFKLDDSLSVRVKKSRISLSKQTVLQLILMSNEEISFEENMDLDDFYLPIREKIHIPKNSLIGLSEVLTFNGDLKNPYEIFEMKLDPELSSEIKIELTSEMIEIHYRSKEIMFNDLNNKKSLRYPYVYMGLQRAIIQMVLELDGESLDIETMDVPSGLNLKLYKLMSIKGVSEVNLENIDNVIDSITDSMIGKYVSSVKDVMSNVD